MPLPLLATMVMPLVTEFAPTLIRKFAGDTAGTVAEAVAQTAQKVTGQDVSTPEGLQAAQEALRKDPALSLKFKESMAEVEVRIEEAYLADRQDARARDVALRKSGDGNIRANVMLALAFLAVVIIAALLTLGTVKGDSAIAGFLIGIGGMFARNIGSAFDFEFGSSRGSKEKGAAIEKSAAMAAMAPTGSALTSAVANAALDRFKRDMAGS